MPIVAVVGAGLVGRSWAVVFARAGFEVRVTDSSAEALAAAPGLIRQGLEDLAAHGLVKDVKTSCTGVTCVPFLAEAVAGVDLVQESGPENVEIKKELFAQLDRFAPPSAILASSTSFIVASHFSEGLKGRERCMVAHPVNPPHLVPIVELCGAPWTSAKAIERARALYEQADQVPITVHKEVDGFVLNRLQAALLAESFRLVGEGVVSPQDLDKTIKDGLGLRWSFMGPFETIELNAPGGIGDYCARYAGSLRQLTSEPPSASVWDEANIGRILSAWGRTPSPDEIAKASAWRDKRLAALKAHKQQQPKN